MVQCIKRCIWDVIHKNTREINDFRDDEILLLQEMSPIEYCGVLLELQQIYSIDIFDEAITGRDLETVNAICSYIIDHLDKNMGTNTNAQGADNNLEGSERK